MDKTSRSLRRYQAFTHMNRRVKDHKQYPYCRSHECWYIKNPYRMKEQPQVCSCLGCGNQRKYVGQTIQELIHKEAFRGEL